jgi:hypothetical protein
MHIGEFQTIKKAFSSIDRVQFDALPLAEQLKELRTIMKRALTTRGMEGERANEFLFLYHLSKGVNAADYTAMKNSLGVQDGKGWAKPTPHPISLATLMLQWGEEYTKIPEMAATIPHAALLTETVNDTIAESVRAVLGLGGMEAHGHPIKATDPIMALFIEAVKVQLMVVAAPTWFEPTGKVKPTVEDGRSQFEVAADLQAAKLRARMDAAKETARHRQQKETQAFRATVEAATAILKDDAVATNIVTALTVASFDDLKRLLSKGDWLDASTIAHFSSLGASIEGSKQHLLRAIQAHKPDWFVELADGEVCLRRGVGKPKPALKYQAKKQKAICHALSKFCEAYGTEFVLGVVEQALKELKASATR